MKGNFKLRNIFRLGSQTKNHLNPKPETRNPKLGDSRKGLSQDGVTIIEAMMVMGVIGFVMSLVSVLAYTGVTAWQKQSTRLQLENQAQNFMDIVSQKLRQAQPSTVSISNYTGEMNYSLISFTEFGQTSPVSIYLKTTTGNGGAVDRKVWMFDPDYLANTTTASYALGGQILASNVVSLFFTYPHISDTSRILMSISMQKYPFKNKPPVYYQASEEIYVRN